MANHGHMTYIFRPINNVIFNLICFVGGTYRNEYLIFSLYKFE